MKRIYIMHFSSGINRSPYQSMIGFLQVTSGCSHGSCKFCTFYKDSPFAISTIEEDIKEIRNYGYRFKRIFLQGADSFILSYEKLMQITKLIYKYLPYTESIDRYDRIDNVKNKSIEQLSKLAEMDYSNFYFGNESGDDNLLNRISEGYKSEFIVEQLLKLDEANMKYVANFF